MIDWQNIFGQPVKNDLRTYDNVRKFTICQGDIYHTAVCLLGYPFFKENYKLIATDLSRKRALDADPKPVQQINFTRNLDRPGQTTISFITEETK